MKESIFSKWWSKLPRWRKAFAIVCWTVAVLIVLPPALSYLLSVINHDSFYSYDRLWFYYPYLEYILPAIIIFTLVYVVIKTIKGSSDSDST